MKSAKPIPIGLSQRGGLLANSVNCDGKKILRHEAKFSSNKHTMQIIQNCERKIMRTNHTQTQHGEKKMEENQLGLSLKHPNSKERFTPLERKEHSKRPERFP